MADGAGADAGGLVIADVDDEFLADLELTWTDRVDRLVSVYKIVAVHPSSLAKISIAQSKKYTQRGQILEDCPAKLTLGTQ